jgi:hypothetical protein
MEPEKTPTTDTPKGGGRKALTVVGVLGAIAVNIAAFMLSADAITTVAKAAGISPHIAWAMVLSVDGMMLTGTVVFVTRKIMGRSATYPAIVLAAGVLLSVVCNALHAKASGGQMVHLDGNTRAVVSAIPAASLAFSFHLIADMIKDALGAHPKDVSADTSLEVSAERPSARLPEVSVERLPSVSRTPAQTPAIASPQTPERVSAERPKTARQTAPAKTKKTPTASATDTRAKARELLKANPDMNGNQLAAALKLEPSGHVRTMRRKLLAELTDAGEIPRMRAVGA